VALPKWTRNTGCQPPSGRGKLTPEPSLNEGRRQQKEEDKRATKGKRGELGGRSRTVAKRTVMSGEIAPRREDGRKKNGDLERIPLHTLGKEERAPLTPTDPAGGPKDRVALLPNNPAPYVQEEEDWEEEGSRVAQLRSRDKKDHDNGCHNWEASGEGNAMWWWC